MDNNQSKLIADYLAGRCTEEEKALVEQWYNTLAAKKENPISHSEADLEQIDAKMWADIEGRTTVKKHHFLNHWMVKVAASLILMLGVLAYFTKAPQTSPGLAKLNASPSSKITAHNDNHTTLTLGNGRQLVLDQVKDGTVLNEGSISIQKNKEGELTYSFTDKGQSKESYNTIATPRGEKYNIQLSDGTLAILDAQSSIRFPVAFQGNTRTVSTTGQVYFEVAHNAAKPFVVTTGKQTLEVLGTHFNIENYGPNNPVTTTLLQGKVKVKYKENTAILKPGQQTQVDEKHAEIALNTDVNLEEVMAWKNGFFKFTDEDIVSVMEQLSRWYDIDVQYKGRLPVTKFSGKIYRKLDFEQVVDILRFSKINIRQDGRNVTISN